VIFFIDENIPKNIAYMLSYYEQVHEVRAHLDYFEKGTPDTIWMRAIASWDKSTAIVCADGGIIRNKVESQVLKECNLTFVLLSPGWVHLKWFEQGWRIIKVWPDIVNNVVQALRPMVFMVMFGGLKIQSYGPVQNL
jgi:hypothetical protein